MKHSLRIKFQKLNLRKFIKVWKLIWHLNLQEKGFIIIVEWLFRYFLKKQQQKKRRIIMNDNNNNNLVHYLWYHSFNCNPNSILFYNFFYDWTRTRALCSILPNDSCRSIIFIFFLFLFLSFSLFFFSPFVSTSYNINKNSMKQENFMSDS